MVAIKSALSYAALSVALSSTTMAAFNPNGKDNLVLYWGQAYGSDPSLLSYCQRGDADVYVISFLNQFGTNEQPSFNVEGCYKTFNGSALFNCPGVGSDIKGCQALGKKVFLSLGGSIGKYGFANTDDAVSFAGELWDLFGAGTSNTRPFGDAVVDGFDLDIENFNDVGYPQLVNTLRSHFNGGEYYISTAPFCGTDAGTTTAMEQSDIDFAFIQFYNGNCAANSRAFNWNTWTTFVQTRSYNKNLKLYLGLLGGAASGTGFVPPQDIGTTISDIYCDSAFGGVSFWQASTAYETTYKNQSYPEIINALFADQTCDTPAISSQLVKNVDPSLSFSSSNSASSTAAVGINATVTSSAAPGDEIGTYTKTEVGTATDVVTAYTTYCPFATSFVEGNSTYIVTEATTVTVTNCPCTRTTEWTTEHTTVCPLSELRVESSSAAAAAASSAAAVATATGSATAAPSAPSASSAPGVSGQPGSALPVTTSVAPSGYAIGSTNGTVPSVAPVAGSSGLATSNGASATKVGAGLMAVVVAFAVLF